MIEPSCCKKLQKKSQPRSWLGEKGTSEGSEWYQIGPKWAWVTPLTPNTPLIHTSFTYPKLNMDEIYGLKFYLLYVQGISLWNVSFKLTLTDINMLFWFCLKVDLECWDWIFLGITTSFQKSLTSLRQKHCQF